MLFVLSTKTTTERFLLKLCQRNGNLKRIALSGLFLAESSGEEDEKVSASEEEAVTEKERANEIQENVESSYSEETGGHFVCVCVHPLNENSAVASNLMAGNRKLA